jgi:hydroxymethylglutaryl-CoA lyase
MAQGTDEGSPELDANRSPWEAMLPTSLELIEVGPRDGFQIIPDFIETADKITVIESLIGSGIRRMEVTSFVHPKAVPQMRDAAEVMRSIERNGCQCFAMTPNLKGAERAIEAGVDMLNLVVSASESHNRSNVRRSVDESLDGFPAVIELAEKAGTPTRASVSTVFGCPFEGNVPIERVMHVCRRLVDIGCVELNLCDTTGMAHPGQVAEVARAVLNEFDEIKVAMHFHNTRGAGAANMLAAIQVGIRAFESSFGGLGGCPRTGWLPIRTRCGRQRLHRRYGAHAARNGYRNRNRSFCPDPRCAPSGTNSGNHLPGADYQGRAKLRAASDSRAKIMTGNWQPQVSVHFDSSRAIIRV